MSLFTQDVFAEAKALGLTEGFVGSFAQLQQLVLEATQPPALDSFEAFEAAGLTPSYQQAAGFACFNDVNDPDGEGWNAWCEQQGDLAAEKAASRWFEDRGGYEPDMYEWLASPAELRDGEPLEPNFDYNAPMAFA